MNIYRLLNTAVSNTEAEHFGTQAEAHNAVKSGVAKHNWPGIRIELVDVQTDKAGIVAALNGVAMFQTVSTWAITKRGGLAPVANGE